MAFNQYYFLKNLVRLCMTIRILYNSGLKLVDLHFLQLCLKKRLSYVL